MLAARMALADPNVLWDVGLQLPFMAMLGPVSYAEPLTRAFERAASSRPQPGMVLGGLAVLLRLAYQPLS